MRYRHDPERPDEPIVEASARDLDAFRDMIRRYAWRKYPILGSDVEDLVQLTIIAALRLIEEGRVRGAYTKPIVDRVKALLLDVAWRIGAHQAEPYRRGRARGQVPYDPDIAEKLIGDRRSPLDEQVEARRLLRRIEQEAGGQYVAILLRVESGEKVEDIARDLAFELSTIYTAKQRARAQIAKALARKPKSQPQPQQATPRRPRDRKRKR